MRRIFRGVFGVGLMMAGILAIGVVSVLAASSGQSTTLNVTVPTSISLTGLAASYSLTAPAGINTSVVTGPITISTNNSTGYTLKVAAGAANFVGTINPANVMPASADAVAYCPSTDGTGCTPSQPLTTGGITVHSTTAPTTGDIFTVSHVFVVPGDQPADTYTGTVTYTATSNP